MTKAELPKELLLEETTSEPSIEEKTRLYEEWKKTGWSQTKFCKRYNISL